MKTYLSKFQLIIGFIVILFANAYADAPLNESGKKLTGDFVLSLTDFKLQAQNGKHNQLQCQPNSITFKPQRENQSREININQFVHLWDSGSSFDQMHPNAMLVFHQGGNMFQMTFKVSNISQSSDSQNVLMIADTYNAKAAFTKNGKNITRNQFKQAAENNDKKNIALMIDDGPDAWDPR